MTALSIDDLFTPLTADEVLSTMLEIGTILGLDVTAWQPGGVGRTSLTIQARKIADAMSIISTMNKGGFLDYAAQVTPEGGPGWLDICALSVYRVTRVPPTYASTSLTFTASGATPGTFAPGTLHATTANGKTFTNTETVSVPANGVIVSPFKADVAGSDSSAGTGAISALVTPLIGVSVSNAAPAVGTDAESNANLVARCRLKLASLSEEGPQGAYDYNARTINGENQVAVASGPLSAPDAPCTRSRTVTNPSTGAVTTYVASAAGAYATPPNHTGDVPKQVDAITDGAPTINVQLAAHGYVTGDNVLISGAATNTGANGIWQIVRIDANNFHLVGSVFSNAAGAGGLATRFSDLDLIDKSIQANAVPDAVTATTVSAAPLNIAVTGVITVTSPATNLTDAAIIANAQAALAKFASTIPIGGLGSLLLVYLEGIRAAIFNATKGTVDVSLSAPVGNVSVPVGGVVEFSPTPSLSVVRV